MVQFNENGFTVDIETGICPHDNYVATVSDIIGVLQAVNPDMRQQDNYYFLLELLRAMMPDEAQVKKLIV